jgi:hypothetical protein
LGRNGRNDARNNGFIGQKVLAEALAGAVPILNA